MILGATRTPFQRPSAASGSYTPQLPHTGFFSHFHPLTQVTHAMRSASMYRPPLVPSMGPQPLPTVAAPAPAAPVAPTVPTPGGTAGFGGSGFGSHGAMQHAHVDPYMIMRQGVIPGVSPSGSNIRAGVRNAGARVHRSMPFQTAPLPPPPPPPAPPMPAMPATGVKGFLGALSDHLGFPRSYGRRSRGFFSRHAMLPEMPNNAIAANSCETIGPRSDGLYVTICNGQVTSYSDGQGNVRANPYAV